MIHGVGRVYLCVLLVTGIWVISTFWLLIINTGVQIFPWVHAFYSCGYILRSEIVGSYDNFKFNCLENCHAIFRCGCSVLHFHQQYKSFSLIAFLTMLVIYWLLIIMFVGVKWYLSLFLICISLITTFSEHDFLLAAYTFFLGKYQTLPIFNRMTVLFIF